MKKCALVLLAVLMALVGCAPKLVEYIPMPDTEAVDFSAGFRVGQVNDLSGFVWPPNEKKAFDLKETLASELSRILKYCDMWSEDKNRIDVDILVYAPGNAFVRWLFNPLPITGGKANTKLYVKAMIFNPQNVKVAEIPVNADLGAGIIFGGIGFYKDVFTFVPDRIVGQLMVQGKIPRKKRPRKEEKAQVSTYSFGE